MKNMVNIISIGSCPNCGNRRFVVHESSINIYLTDRDGNIIDSKENDYKAVGICTKCNTQFDMMNTSYGFIPMTKLRKILFQYTPHNILIEDKKDNNISNPMDKNC